MWFSRFYARGSMVATTTHGRLYRLIISADSESTEIPLEIDTPPSPCVVPAHSRNSPYSSIAENIVDLRLLMRWPVWVIYLRNVTTLADACLHCMKLVRWLDVCHLFGYSVRRLTWL